MPLTKTEKCQVCNNENKYEEDNFICDECNNCFCHHCYYRNLDADCLDTCCVRFNGDVEICEHCNKSEHQCEGDCVEKKECNMCQEMFNKLNYVDNVKEFYCKNCLEDFIAHEKFIYIPKVKYVEITVTKTPEPDGYDSDTGEPYWEFLP